ncbi:MAG: hypothetical protein LH679_14890 [Cyanobacteria bacterium CAN_BIN43]|nr:hypothetical protein [Cyanobacteria bacterium CAN_BIN43]
MDGCDGVAIAQRLNNPVRQLQGSVRWAVGLSTPDALRYKPPHSLLPHVY